MAVRLHDSGSAERRFIDALRDEEGVEAERNCFGRELEFVDYQAAPSPEQAEVMCGGCPMYALCLAGSEESRPAWGVRAGVAWYQGHKHHNFRGDPLDLDLILPTAA